MQTKELEKQFERLINDNQLLLYKVCRVYAFSADDRKDLFQDIVIQLWKSFPKYRAEAKFSTWMYRVAINTSISRIRKEKNFIHSYQLNELPTQLQDKDDAVEREEQFATLYAAIDQLNEIEKAIIMLYLEDKTYEEMEEIMGMNQGNLRVKMTRIKEKLRQLTK